MKEPKRSKQRALKLERFFAKKERDNNIIVFAGCSYVPFGIVFIECNATFGGYIKKSTKSKTLFGVA